MHACEKDLQQIFNAETMKDFLLALFTLNEGSKDEKEMAWKRILRLWEVVLTMCSKKWVIRREINKQQQAQALIDSSKHTLESILLATQLVE